MLLADLGGRHTGCHDAAMHLEIVLAMPWWWRQCKGDNAMDKILTRGKPDEGGRAAVCSGVTALKLRYESLIREFDAREHACAFADAVLPRRQAGNCGHATPSEVDLMQLLRRDPTTRKHKSRLRCKGHDALLNWTTIDDSSGIKAGAAPNSSCLLCPWQVQDANSEQHALLRSRNQVVGHAVLAFKSAVVAGAAPEVLQTIA